MNTAEIGARLLLADEFGEPLRAQRAVRGVVLAALGGDEAAGGWSPNHPHSVRSRLYLFGSSSPMAAIAGPFGAGHDDAGVAVVVPDQLAAARRTATPPRCVWSVLGRLGWRTATMVSMPVSPASVIGPAERHRLGAHRHAAEIGVEIDAGEDASVARAQRRADLLPVVAIAPLDRFARGGDQFAGPARSASSTSASRHFASSFSPSRISLRRIRALAGAARGGGDGGRRLRLTVAEIDQRRDRVARPAAARACPSTAPDSRITAGSTIGIGRRLVLQFGDDALGDLRADAGRARDRGLVAQRDGGGEIAGLERAEHRRARPWRRRPARSAAGGTIRARHR